MDYEKAYKESFEAAKGLHDAGNALTKKQMEIVFPQLSESEDERIRKELLEEIEFIIPHDDETDSEGLILPSYHARIDRYKSYLEKQKEQKPAEWSEEDEEIRQALIEFLREAYSRGNAPEECAKWLVWLDRPKEQKAVEWSEEDEEVMEDLYNFVISDFIQDHIHETRWKPWKTTLERNRQNRLKSIRPVSKESLQSWKPSEEQMEALLKAVDKARELHYTSIDGYDGYNELRSLYEQIKKLM